MAWNGTKHFTSGAWRYGDANRYVAENLDSFYTLNNCNYSAGASNPGLTTSVDNVGVQYQYLNLGSAGAPDESYRLFITWGVVLYGASGGAASMTINICDVYGTVLKTYPINTLTLYKSYGTFASTIYPANLNPGFVVNAVCNVGSCFVLQSATYFVAPLA